MLNSLKTAQNLKFPLKLRPTLLDDSEKNRRKMFGVIGQFERKYKIILKTLKIYNFCHYATKIKEKR